MGAFHLKDAVALMFGW